MRVGEIQPSFFIDYKKSFLKIKYFWQGSIVFKNIIKLVMDLFIIFLQLII